MLNVVIFGPPGSGKGTQGIQIAEKFDLAHISTGDLLRAAIHNNTAEGIIAKSYIDKGELVPDETIIDMLDGFFEKLPAGKGVVLDGFPRTVSQAEALTEMMEEHGSKVSVLLDLDVKREELIDRLLKRGEISGRSDDNEETINKRLEIYEADTLPVIDFYKKKKVYKSIDGEGGVDEIFGRITDALAVVK